VGSVDNRVTVGDIGKRIRVLIGFDVSGADAMKMKVLKPDGETKMIWEAVVDPDDNKKILYMSKAGDFDQPGFYILYSHIKMDNWIIRGRPVLFKVYSEWEEWEG
jgi:hypothetical protein